MWVGGGDGNGRRFAGWGEEGEKGKRTGRTFFMVALQKTNNAHWAWRAGERAMERTKEQAFGLSVVEFLFCIKVRSGDRDGARVSSILVDDNSRRA